MTPEQIAKAREIIAAATPGPWIVDNRDGAIVQDREDNGEAIVDAVTGLRLLKTNGRFIAAARTGWSESLDAVELLQMNANAHIVHLMRLESENNKLRAEVECQHKMHFVLNATLGQATDTEVKLRGEIAELKRNTSDALIRENLKIYQENEKLRTENERLRASEDYSKNGEKIGFELIKLHVENIALHKYFMNPSKQNRDEALKVIGEKLCAENERLRSE